jgi:hypothetical protein
MSEFSASLLQAVDVDPVLISIGGALHRQQVLVPAEPAWLAIEVSEDSVIYPR